MFFFSKKKSWSQSNANLLWYIKPCNKRNMVWKIVVLSLAVKQLISLSLFFTLLFVAIHSECEQKQYAHTHGLDIILRREKK